MLPLDYALALTYLYAETGDRKYESAALLYLERYVAERLRPSRIWRLPAAVWAERNPG